MAEEPEMPLPAWAARLSGLFADKTRRITQKDIAERIGMTPQQFGRYVNGQEPNPKYGTQQDIARACGVSPGWLWFGDGPDPRWAETASAAISRLRDAADAVAAASAAVHDLDSAVTTPAAQPAVQQPPAAQPGATTGTPTTGTTPATAGTAAPVRTARRTRPSRIEPAPEPPATYTPATPDREWTEAELPDLQVGNILALSGVAAGGARVPEIVKGAYFHENGVRHIVASISGRSMEPRIASGARVVLEVLKPVLTLVSGEIPDNPGVRSGDVYLVELDDGEATLKRLDIFRGVASLRAYNEHEWGVAGVRLLTPGEQIRVLAKFVGIYKGKLPA